MAGERLLATRHGTGRRRTRPRVEQRWELATVSAEHAPTAKDVDGERRIYAVRGDELSYATELAPAGQPFAPHLNGRLARI
jgi:hypothetical protein